MQVMIRLSKNIYNHVMWKKEILDRLIFGFQKTEILEEDFLMEKFC